jgi:hypothetical protein
MISNHSFCIKLTVESAVLALITRKGAVEKDNLPAGMRLVKERHSIIGSGGRKGETGDGG